MLSSASQNMPFCIDFMQLRQPDIGELEVAYGLPIAYLYTTSSTVKIIAATASFC